MICGPYITPSDMIGCGCPSNAPAGLMESAALKASEALYLLTGQQYRGTCEDTVWPCPNRGGWYYWLDGMFACQIATATPQIPGFRPCGCDPCGCGGGGVRFDRSDITGIEEVQIHGDALDPSEYRLITDRYGYRLDRIGGGFPCSNSPGEIDGWSVTYTYGYAPPELIKGAAASLASEIVKSCVDDGSCRLPKRVTSVTTEGTTYAVLDPMDFLRTGGTGLYDVDLAIKAVNPHGVKRSGSVLSPDSPNIQRVV